VIFIKQTSILSLRTRLNFNNLSFSKIFMKIAIFLKFDSYENIYMRNRRAHMHISFSTLIYFLWEGFALLASGSSLVLLRLKG